ncbi:hypothetical protein MLD38_009588 [Melastoma candidum]|uniref:Uncharacterized protein n=1 Tax=Melastoma candidum TaxID=119954 RepID=A0ACB9RXP4_9MYRT|nr:hypothetical protein MLD38_009588 [Melastoma candidum]
MKCLNLIYVRLLRTWRAMEMEKPCAVSRSITNRSSSPASRSFRVEAVMGMELRQQDPYGVFAAEGSIPRDIGPYKNLVMFTSASLNPKCISSSSSIPLLKKLWELISLLQTVDLRSMTEQQKLAFWINIYNACLMHGFLQYGVPSTPEKLHELANKASLNIGGNMLSPQAIEHYILRRPSSSAMSEEPNEDFIRGTLRDRFCQPQCYIRPVSRNPIFPSGEDIHGGWNQGRTGEVKGGVPAGGHSSDNQEEDRDSGALGWSDGGFDGGYGVTGGVGLPSVAQLRDSQEIDGGMPQGKTSQQQ